MEKGAWRRLAKSSRPLIFSVGILDNSIEFISTTKFNIDSRIVFPFVLELVRLDGIKYQLALSSTQAIFGKEENGVFSALKTW